MATTQDIYSMTDTWNAGGTTFEALKMTITNSASAADSLFMNFTGSTNNYFRVRKDGRIQGDSGSGVESTLLPSFGNWTAGGEFRASSFDLGTGAYRAGTAAGAPDSFIMRNSAGLFESNVSGTAGTGGIIPGERFATTQVVTALTNNIATAQNVFAAANDVLTLVAATTYFFEFQYFINTGTTTHTTATEFTASSAFTSINYLAELWSTTAGTISTTAPSVLDVNVSTAVVLNATSIAPRTTIRGRGIIRTNAATTVTPKITFSAGPTGTCEVAVNSYFRCYPVGSNTVAAVGAWA